jgi:hypothetical protein
MSAAYLALGVLAAKRIPGDRKSVFAFIALSVTLLTVAVPLYYDMDGITLGWAAEAVVLLYLAWQFNYRPARIGAFLILLLAIGRVFFVHWPLATHAEPFTLVFNRPFLILLAAPVAAAACAIIHYAFRAKALPEDHAMRRVSAAGAGLMLLAFLHVELGQWLTLRAGGWHISPDYLKTCSLAVLWALGSAAFLAAGLATAKPSGEAGWRDRRKWLLAVGAAPLIVAIVHAFSLYDLSDSGYLLALNGRFAAALIVAGVTWAWACAPVDRSWRYASLVLAGYLSILLANVEVHA